MRRERLKPDNPLEWLNQAESDLLIARAPIPGVYLEHLCYHAQQCVEKALKAILIRRVGDFPFSHNLLQLVDLVEKSGVSVPEEIAGAVVLNTFAVAGRYPGAGEPTSEVDWHRAIDLASSVLEWANKLLSK